MNRILNLMHEIKKLKLKQEKLDFEIKKLNEENKNIFDESIELDKKEEKLEKIIFKLKEYNEHLTKTKIKGTIISILPVIICIVLTLVIKLVGFNINNLICLAINIFSVTVFLPFFSVLGFKEYYDYKQFIKHKGIKEYEKDLSKLKEKKKSNEERTKINIETINNLKDEKCRLDLKIQSSMLELLKYEIIKDSVIRCALYNQQILDNVIGEITKEIQKTKKK